MSMPKVKFKNQRSRSKGSKQILLQFGCFQTITIVWILRWLRNDAQSLMWHRRGALLFFKVICQISRWQGPENQWFWSDLNVSGLWLQSEFTDGYEMMHSLNRWYLRGALLFCEVIFPISRWHRGWKLMFWLWFESFQMTTSWMAMKWHTSLLGAWKRIPVVFLGHLSNFKVTWAEKSIWIWVEQDYKAILSYQIPQICLVLTKILHFEV